ncbi:MAG: GIDE domain-containing protein [Gammaproteobacteria bacterium]
MPALAGLAQQIAAAGAGEFWFWTAAAIAGSVAAFAGAFFSLHKARLIENTPTSRVRSAAQGYVELDGFARLLPGPEIHSPLTGTRCCWWRYRVQKQESTWHNGKRRTEWRTIRSGTSDELFVLADPTGECVVDPDGARVYPSLRRQWRGHSPQPARAPEKTPLLQFGDYRYEEQLVKVGDPLYALGWFRTQSAHHELDESAGLAALLREWKADQRTLLARFDTSGDGRIDLDEWEAARRTALAQLRGEQLRRAVEPDVHVLCRAADGRPYILSTLAQPRLTRRYRSGAALMFFLSILSGTCGVFALTARGVF